MEACPVCERPMLPRQSLVRLSARQKEELSCDQDRVHYICWERLIR